MIYDYLGNVIYDSITSQFSENLELDYSFDAASDANFTVLRIFRTKKDGTIQKPIIRYPGFHKAEEIADEGWEVTINAGLGWDGEIDGIAIADGEIINNDPASYHAGSIPLVIDADGNLSTVPATYTAQQALAGGAVWATCGFCPIIVNYEEVEFPEVEHVTHFTENAQRQIIGQFGNGDYAIVTCAGRSYDHSDGWTLAEAQAICKKLGLKFAYNLDGGTSTATYIKKHAVYDYMKDSTRRVVPSFIVFSGVSLPNSQSHSVLLKTDVINNLNSTVEDKPLSGNMGRVLNEKINSVVGGITAKGDILSTNLPEASAENKGWQYYCTDTGKYAVSDGTHWVYFSIGLPENVIESISVNGVPQTVDANKNVDITVPNSVFGPSGSYHSDGLVPDPGSTAGNTRFLREDGTWSEASSVTTTSVEIAVSDWSNNTCTKNVTGMTSSSTVIVSPSSSSEETYSMCGVKATAQGSGTLTFTCSVVPSSAVTTNLILIK